MISQIIVRFPYIFYVKPLLKTYYKEEKPSKSMTSLILVKFSSIVLYTALFQNLLKTRKPFEINEIPNSYHFSLHYFI